MKVFHKALLYGPLAVVLLFSQTSLALAQKSGSRGGSAGRSSGGSTFKSSNGGMKLNSGSNRMVNSSSGNFSSFKQASSQSANKIVQSSSNKLPVSPKLNNTKTMTSKFSSQNNLFKQGTSSVGSFALSPRHLSGRSNFFCGTGWSGGGCFPNHHHGYHHHCGYGYGWNHCWSYPCWNNCYYPTYYSCYTPCYDYCFTSPVCYTYQTPVVVTEKVIELIQPVATVETTTTATTVTPPASDLNFLTGSVVGMN